HLKGPAEEHLFMHRMKMYEAGLSAMLGYRPSTIFGGPFDVVVIGNDHRGEIELDMNTSYTVHLRALPPGRARYHRLDADSASMLSGHEPDCGTIGRRLASFFA
ncbi:MAG TPA: hypothetical protein VFS00_03220, partial [Polyangiaceae bacterium]|nr:hypothetical protein [Polyangiaceae bacterium]